MLILDRGLAQTRDRKGAAPAEPEPPGEYRAFAPIRGSAEAAPLYHQQTRKTVPRILANPATFLATPNFLADPATPVAAAFQLIILSARKRES